MPICGPTCCGGVFQESKRQSLSSLKVIVNLSFLKTSLFEREPQGTSRQRYVASKSAAMSAAQDHLQHLIRLLLKSRFLMASGDGGGRESAGPQALFVLRR